MFKFLLKMLKEKKFRINRFSKKRNANNTRRTDPLLKRNGIDHSEFATRRYPVLIAPLFQRKPINLLIIAKQELILSGFIIPLDERELKLII